MAPSFAACLTIAVVTDVLGRVGGVKLTPDNWAAQTKGKTVFVKFFAPWCGHCKKIKPDWDRLTSDFQESHTGLVGEVDCTAEGKMMCEMHGVKGYPGLLWGSGDGQLQAYTGERNYEAMKLFADEHLGDQNCGPGALSLCSKGRRQLFRKFMKISPEKLDSNIKIADSQIKQAEHAWAVLEHNVSQEIGLADKKRQRRIKNVRKKNAVPQVADTHKELTPANWDKETKGKTLFVKFFAPWCGHCKAMKPDWDRLMSDFEGTLTALVSEVDCTAKGEKLCEKHGVTGYPRLMWGKAEEQLTTYSGQRDYESLRSFADDHLGEACSADYLERCEEDRKEDMELFGKMSKEERDKRIKATEKGIERAQKAYEDQHWNFLAQLDTGEQNMKDRIKAIKDQGLAEAKTVQAWNRKQPPGFWKPPKPKTTTPPPLTAALPLQHVVLTIAGVDVRMLEALTAMLVLAITMWYFGRRRPINVKTCTGRHILMKQGEEIHRVKARIEAGEDFAEVARECSLCPSGKDGGCLGRRECGSMEPELDKVCFDPATRLGEVVGPIKSKFGFHLIVVDSRLGVSQQARSSTSESGGNAQATKDKNNE